MNFFTQQDKARSNTSKLVLLFSLAVLSLIIITQVFIIVLYAWSQGIPITGLESLQTVIESMQGSTLLIIAFTVISIVFLAFLYKSSQLSGGGQPIAEAMGGRLINTCTRDPDEKKILNVVEEMAIASGTPVPQVYVIEDYAINAFAAGHNISDAVIGITRGCIRSLTRDELQGVVAHEFSHIFNGDMKLNIRLISVLHGILIIGLLGNLLLRISSPGRYHRRGYYYSSSSSNSKDAAPLLFLGLGLVVIGYLGTFFGNLIKAAVSRQREYLADASAVQYTRNPDGIANALKKIGGYDFGSLLESPETDEISHLLFSEGVTQSLNGMMATHPPLQERILRIDKRWNGEFPHVPIPKEVMDNPESIEITSEGNLTSKLGSNEAVSALAAGASAIISEANIPPQAIEQPSEQFAEQPGTMIDYVGDPSPAHLETAHTILTSIPAVLSEAAHEPYGSRSVVYCLLIDQHNKDIQKKQVEHLSLHADTQVYALTRKLYKEVKKLPVQYRLPLLDLCIPSLKQLGNEPYSLFKNNLLALIKADDQIDLFEWALYRICMHHLEEPQKIKKHVSLKAVSYDCIQLLSAITMSSHSDISQAQSVMDNAAKALELNREVRLNQNILQDTSTLDNALKRCNFIYPLQKPTLIKACCKCLGENPSPESIELIRAIADGLDVPMPPQLPGQKIA